MNAILIWYAAGTIAAIAVGWVAAIVHMSGHAPIGLVSLGVGIVIGAALATLAAIQRIAGFRRLVVGTILLATVTALAEHAWLYVDFRRQWHESRAQSDEVAMFRAASPPTPGEYLRHEFSPTRAALWSVDAVLIAGAAVGAAIAVANRLSRPRVANDAAKSLNPEP